MMEMGLNPVKSRVAGAGVAMVIMMKKSMGNKMTRAVPEETGE